MIEQLALRLSEGLAAEKDESEYADDLRSQTETILATVRAATTGYGAP